MKDYPLSIICVFHNQREDAEATLTTLYEEMTIPFEMIIIDNGSDDDTNTAIESVLRHFNHDSTYFFSNPDHRGHALCINDALANATCPIVWVPGILSGFNAHNLSVAVGDLLRSQAPFAVCGGEVPIRPDRWIQAISDHTLPTDASFLVRLDAISPSHRFLNPFLSRAMFPEWIIRTDSAGLVIACKDPICDSATPFLSDADRNEMFLSLVRSGRWKLTDITDVYKTVKSSAAVRLGNDVSTIERLIRDGEIQTALDAVDKLLALEPDRVDAILLKVKCLERLRKYVEAAELKRKIRTGAGAEPAIIKKSMIMIVDPSEDPGDVVDDVIEDVGADRIRPDDDRIRLDDDEIRADAIRPDDRPDIEQDSDIAPRASDPEQIRISILIPTSTDRKAMLEQTLVALHTHAWARDRELIVVNNGAIDDTAEYLSTLEASKFMNVKVVTNDVNRGFAAAVNQAIDAASGSILVLMHNDVIVVDDAPGKLAALLEADSHVAVAGPVTDHTDNEPQQAAHASDGAPIDLTYLDSFCMGFRKSDALRFDESFGLAWFEDIDFSLTAAGENRRIVADPSTWVHHTRGTTTEDLGIPVQSVGFWKGSDRFHSKWKYAFMAEIVPDPENPVSTLIEIGERINPFFPEAPYVAMAKELFTSEVKHEITSGEWSHAQLQALVRLTMAIDLRDVLRTLEDKMNAYPPDVAFNEMLIQYYFTLSVYSRCKMYIDKVEDEHKTLSMFLFLLKIAFAERDMDQAAELATALSEHCPVNPELLLIASQVHEHFRHEEDAASFKALARQLNPAIA
ncbi:MAG: hypothetical protein RL177_677 [Bacteroidota bacterium]